MTGSDFSITESGSVRAHFQCDGELVSVDFYDGEKRVGTHDLYTRSEAVDVGGRVAKSGIYENFPVPGVLLEDIKSFGNRLRQYGENGC